MSEELRMSARILALMLALTAAGAATAATPPGAPIFAANCAACHQPTGKGIPGAFPALAGDTFVMGDPAKPVTVLLNGRGGMPTFRDVLDDGQIAGVLSYVRSAWGNKAPAVDPKLVTRLRGTKTAAAKPQVLGAH